MKSTSCVFEFKYLKGRAGTLHIFLISPSNFGKYTSKNGCSSTFNLLRNDTNVHGIYCIFCKRGGIFKPGIRNPSSFYRNENGAEIWKL